MSFALFLGTETGLNFLKEAFCDYYNFAFTSYFQTVQKKNKKKKKCLPLKVSHIINFKWYIERQFFFTDLSNCARLKITPSSIIAFSFNYVRKNADFPTDVDQPSRLFASFPVHGIKCFCYYEISIFRGEFLGYSVS